MTTDEIGVNINKKNNESLDVYINLITSRCKKNIPVYKNNTKIDDNRIVIPTINNYSDMPKHNYNVNQLKSFAKSYKLKISGNKSELLLRVYSFLHFSSFIIKIQKVFRGTLARKYGLLHGPARLNRKICNNSTDFITMEPIESINYHQFLSYTDNDGFIYGFDIVSLYNLYLKNNKDLQNPYNRKIFPESIIKTIKTILRLSKILKIYIKLDIEDDMQLVSTEKAIELRCLTLFQTIDSLGNYSNPQWFLSLDKNQIIKFICELIDIWNFRAQLSPEIKRNICPPIGDPFRTLSVQYIQYIENNINNLRKTILEILEKLINNGIDNDSKSLGAYYVLGALTLVNSEAAIALPWLYQSFV